VRRTRYRRCAAVGARSGNMTTTLITGADKGLGFETACRLIAAAHTVYIGCSDTERGLAAAELLGARLVHLDVTDEDSVQAAARTIGDDGGLDVLINNAGIEGRTPDGEVITAADTTAELMRTLFETNVFGTVRVTHAFLPLLQRSPAPVIVNLSSGLASISRTTAPTPRPTCIPVSHTRRPKRPSTWSRPSTQKLSPPCASTPLNPATRPPI